MNPPCAKCKKTVYPVEKLSVLDKIWHKACFRCETCELKLTMKTYKGYNKLPYCNTHYPTTKFTAVADTPENMRLKKNTQNQSMINYQKQYELEKGKGAQGGPAPSHEPPRSYEPPALSYDRQPAPSYDRQPAPSYDRQPAPSYDRQPAPSYDRQPQYDPPQPQPPQQQLPSIVQQPLPPLPTAASQSPKYQALYDYSAADNDEVSFIEGDVILEVTVIDDGWMEGRVERTGQYGMLPSNYVEKL